jgi:TatD DNase family protein
MLTDSHCHLASGRFDHGEIPGLLERAEHAGVRRLVTLATSLDDLAENLRLADDPRVHTCIGIHPCDVTNAPDDATAQLAAHTADPRVCAIGETGLDYHHPPPDGWTEDDYHQRQRWFLRRHFELAERAGLNVVIHTRDRTGHASFEDALRIYQEFSPRVRAVFHCFSASREHAGRVVATGGLVSFGGTTTFRNAAMVRETLASCPAGSFMLETDSPYLAPEPHRGTRNEPCRIADIAAAIARVRNETVDSLARHTESACNAFFRFKSGPQ